MARRGSSQEEHTVNCSGRAEGHGNRAGVADSSAWREGGKVGCRVRVRTRPKFAANGSEAGQIGLVRRGESQGERPETGHKLVCGQLGLAQGGNMTRTGQRTGQSQGQAQN